MPQTPTPSSTHDRLLALLKKQGPSVSGKLAAQLGITPTATRLQLGALLRQGFVTHERLGGGVGRPAWLWGLAAAADRLFPDAHGVLCADLTAALTSALPRADVQRVLTSLARMQARKYRAGLPRRATLSAQLRALVRARNADGYMAELRTRPDGAYELIQNHCPVAKAACAFPEICGVEARALRETLGRVKVTLREHRLRGSRRCVLHIRQQKRAT